MGRPIKPRVCEVCCLMKKTTDFNGNSKVCIGCRQAKRQFKETPISSPPGQLTGLPDALLPLVEGAGRPGQTPLSRVVVDAMALVRVTDAQRLAEWSEAVRMQREADVELMKRERELIATVKSMLDESRVQFTTTIAELKGVITTLHDAQKAAAPVAPLSTRAALRSLSSPRFKAGEFGGKESAAEVIQPLTQFELPGKLDAPFQFPLAHTPSVAPPAISREGYLAPLPVVKEWQPPYLVGDFAIEDLLLFAREGFCSWGWPVPSEQKAFLQVLRAWDRTTPFTPFSLSAFASAYWFRRRELLAGSALDETTAGAQLLSVGLKAYPQIEAPTPFESRAVDQADEMRPIVGRILELESLRATSSMEMELLAGSW